MIHTLSCAKHRIRASKRKKEINTNEHVQCAQVCSGEIKPSRAYTLQFNKNAKKKTAHNNQKDVKVEEKTLQFLFILLFC